jgi:hypothetical protein
LDSFCSYCMKYVCIFSLFADFEITSKSVGVCVPTHFKESLSCKLSGKVVNRRYA